MGGPMDLLSGIGSGRLTFGPHLVWSFETGALALDERFHEPGASAPGFRMDDKAWPHGGNAKAVPHGAVFSLTAP
jgi:hypothetical protein